MSFLSCLLSSFAACFFSAFHASRSFACFSRTELISPPSDPPLPSPPLPSPPLPSPPPPPPPPPTFELQELSCPPPGPVGHHARP
ncbi:MAG: hypothetical protein EBR82_76265 [Caulobacteraceae bacterium]|nr:hypothetical protein [Caulobacteraceae bacterium]